ncbi:MAG: CapA family protein [Patescibacteria group bacterium]|nr:CapA family protein [Patescibacteria group bacterium]
MKIILLIIALMAVVFVIGFLMLSNNGVFVVQRQSLLAQIQSEKNDLPLPATDVDAANPEVSLIFVGDIMLSRGVAQKIKEKNSYDYPFLQAGDYLGTGDIVFGNLETTVFDGRKIGTGEMVFRADVPAVSAIKRAGFTVLSLANNHTMNFGGKGLQKTMQNLENVGLQYAGAGNNIDEAYQPVIMEKNGLKFAFLAFTDTDVIPNSYGATAGKPGVAFMDKTLMERAVEQAKTRADFVIVYIHSGNEYQKNPSQRQTDFARAAIDEGAHLVVGSHPHIVQPAETYKGKYIFYSLGNFVFDQRSQNTKEGVIIKTVFDRNGLVNIEPQAVLIRDFSQPAILQGETADKIILRLGLAN